MRLSYRYRLLVSLILFGALIPACRFGNPAASTPAGEMQPSRLLEGTLISVSSPTVEEPTATPAATPTLEPNTLLAAESGLRIHYPDGWKSLPPDSASGTVASFVSQDEQISSDFYVNPIESDKPIDQAARDFNAQVLAGIKDTATLKDEASTLANGHESWTIISSVPLPEQHVVLIVNLTLAENGPQQYAIVTYGPDWSYDDHEAEIASLLEGTVLESPSYNGIPRDQSLMLAGYESTNPREYDPATTHSSGDKKVFSGLVSFDPNLNIVPELAETWQVSPDGKVYTFHLRPNAKFHNGRPVTAQDVIYSWERAASPATKSDTVLTYLGDVVGVDEMVKGSADHIRGLRALGDLTLEVTLDEPKPYFLEKLTYPTAFVVDKANVESGPDWYRTPNGTGPYKLTRWDRFKLIVYERNMDYYLGAPAIPYILEQLFSGEEIRLYESGQVDMANVSASDLARVSDPNDPLHNELISGVGLCTGYVVFDASQPPFDDPDVRRAFTMAFDRKKYIDIVMQGDALPAEGLYPPGLPGYNQNLQGLPYDPERARQLLAKSKYGGPAGLPPIVYTTMGIGNEADGGTAALAEMWKRNLGVDLTIENIEPNFYYDNIRTGNHGQIMDGGWCADYPDPENFADALFHTGAQQNDSHYSNPELDKLLELARVEQDVQRRIALYQQAEQIIVNDAPVLFTTHNLTHVLVKPYVKGFVLSPIDVPLEKYLQLDFSK